MQVMPSRQAKRSDTKEKRTTQALYDSTQEHFRFLEWKKEQGLEMTPSMYDDMDDDLLYIL
jgi:hypothetical protein